jgi:hypothetical protein
MTTVMAVLRFVGGAQVGFQLPEVQIDEIRHRLRYAVVDARGDVAGSGAAVPAPRVWYVDGRRGPGVVERHDPVRNPPSVDIHGGVDGILDDLHLTIALHAVDDVFVHAGVVAVDDRAILLPGRSHVGKSTLVEALVMSGAVYLSDEYARVTPDGTILPYPRPIHLRTPSGRRCVDPVTIGRVADTGVRPGLVLITRYAGDADFDPQPVPPARAALELFDNVVVARTSPVAAMAAVTAVARSAQAFRTVRPDAALATQSVIDLVGSVGRVPHDTMGA